MPPDPNKWSDSRKFFFNSGGDGDIPQEEENGNDDAAEGHTRNLDRAGLSDLFEGLTCGLLYLKQNFYRHYSNEHIAHLTQIAHLKLLVSIYDGMECIKMFLECKLDTANNGTAAILDTTDGPSEQN